MKKLLSLIVAAAMLMSLLAGCTSSTTNSDSPQQSTPPAQSSQDGQDAPAEPAQAGERYIREGNKVTDTVTGREMDLEHLVVASVTKSTGSFWFDSFKTEGDLWAGTNGATHHYVSPVSFDSAAQLAALNDAISLNPDILTFTPISADAVDEVIKQARDAGAIVIGHEAQDMQNVDFTVDPYEAKEYAEHFVDRIAEELGEDCTYAIMVGRLTTPSHMAWAEYFYDYQQEKYPNMKCIQEKGAWLEGQDNEDIAYEVTKQLILAEPDLDIVWTPSSGGMLGIVRAIAELGKTGDIWVSAQARPSASLIGLEQGVILFTSIFYPGAAQAAMYEVGKRVFSGEGVQTGDDLGVEGYNNITLLDGYRVIGDGWIDQDMESIYEVVAKYPDF